MGLVFRSLWVVALAFAGFSCRHLPAGAQDGYELRIEHPLQAGDVYRIEIKIDEQVDDRYLDGEKVVSHERSTTMAEIAGTMTTLAVNRNQVGCKAKIQVEAFKVVSGGKTLIEAKPGDELLVECRNRRPGPAYGYSATLNGQELDPESVSFLFRLIELEPPEPLMKKPSTEQILDISGRKNVGDFWPMNIKAFAETFPGIKMAHDQPRGTTRFASIAEVHGERCAILQHEVEYAGEFLQQDPRVKHLPSKFKIQATLQVPLDVKAKSYSGQVRYLGETVSDVQAEEQGAPRTWRLNTTTDLKRTYWGTCLSSGK